MAEKKEKAPVAEDLPAGLRAIADLPSGAPNEAPQTPSQEHPDRPKTQNERALDTLIQKRQEILEQLKAKNPLVMEVRKRIAAVIPSVRGRGASAAARLFDEMERLEFEIATSAYTPKKEKEMLTRLRVIKAEIAKHKEISAARQRLDAERAALNTVVSDIKGLERELADVRNACDAAYNDVLAERKAAYAARQRRREEQHHKKLDELRDRVRVEKKRQYDDEVGKYMKDYDDTVSMEEICVFEKKEKKKEK